jgi:hypothetical protein
VCLRLLDVDPALGRGGQYVRGRRVRARTMRRHERRCSRMVTGTPPRPTAALLAEGFADVRVLDRTAADAVASLRFARREGRIYEEPAPASLLEVE